MATVKVKGLAPDFENVTGSLEINRRLSDKVLAAFNHAYGVGETDIADQLKGVLRLAEARRPRGDQRSRYDAIEHADLWVGFVDARDNYKKLIDGKSARPAELDSAMSAMKVAYRAWSDV